MSANQPDFQKAQIGVIVILAVVYILQILTPLRLSVDTVVLLSAAESAARGSGLLYQGHATQYPPGYPMLIAALMRLGIAHVWLIVGLSVGSVLLGLATARLFLLKDFFSDDSASLTICIVSLLSFVTIKYTVIPLTDPLFFGVAMCSLAVMRSVVSKLRWRKLALIVVLIVISISIRKIGVTLIPALLWIVIGRPEVRRTIIGLSFRTKVVIGAVVALAAGIVVWLFFTASTMRTFALIDNASAALGGRTWVDSILSVLAFHFRELGEIAINVPFPALGQTMQSLLPFVGAAAFLLVLCGLFSRRRQLGVVDIFFLTYSAVILVWPFYDPRFWLPVLPFLVAYVGLSIQYCVKKGISVHVFELWTMGFAIMGLPVLASSTILSFSNSNFGDRYYVDRYHATYCAAGYCASRFDPTQDVDPDALRLLQAFK